MLPPRVPDDSAAIASGHARTRPVLTGVAARSRRLSSVVNDRFFRQMVGSMRNGVLAVSSDGMLVFINNEACRVLNIAADDELVGRPYAQVLGVHPDLVRIIGSAFELNHLPNRAELRLKGSGRVIGYTLSHVTDDRDRVRGAALFFKDLTRVEQLEERERLRDRLAALGEMAAAIAHEVKNPLASIEVLAGLLRRHLSDRTDVRGLLNDIISEAKMANAIVLEVLDFVRPIRLQLESTPVAQVLQDAVTTAESKVPRRQTGIDITLAAVLPAIQGDRNQLCQLFTNLLTNAFEALDGRGSVRIEAISTAGDPSAECEPARSGSVVIAVADDGPGVPQEIVDRIFSPFFTTKPQGSGLGLAIVRKIVDAHDGRIDVSTAQGRGTCFRVTLPVAVPIDA